MVSMRTLIVLAAVVGLGFVLFHSMLDDAKPDAHAGLSPGVAVNVAPEDLPDIRSLTGAQQQESAEQ